MAGKDEPEKELCKNPKWNQCNLKLSKHASDQTERSEPYRIGSLEASDEIYWQIVTVWWGGQYCSNLIRWPVYQCNWPCLRNSRLFLGCKNWISCFSPKAKIDWPCRHSTVAAAEWLPALSKLCSAQFKSLPPSPFLLLFSTLDKTVYSMSFVWGSLFSDHQKPPVTPKLQKIPLFAKSENSFPAATASFGVELRRASGGRAECEQ